MPVQWSSPLGQQYEAQPGCAVPRIQIGPEGGALVGNAKSAGVGLAVLLLRVHLIEQNLVLVLQRPDVRDPLTSSVLDAIGVI